MVWHVLKLFGDRQGGHLSAAEKTEQDVSFQVVLSIVGEEGFDWRPVLVWPDLPAGDDYGSLLSADAVTKDCELGRPDEQRAWCAKVERASSRLPPPAFFLSAFFFPCFLFSSCFFFSVPVLSFVCFC